MFLGLRFENFSAFVYMRHLTILSAPSQFYFEHRLWVKGAPGKYWDLIGLYFVHYGSVEYAS